jgi:uncharacterized protein YegL
MNQRPGSMLAQRPLHFIILADCSGSMAADGKMQALNVAVREMIPHLVDVASQNPHAAMFVRAIAFSTGARWHIADRVPIEQLVWTNLEAGGYTDLGAALDLVHGEMLVPPMEERALPPAMLLVSDGMPTDDWRAALARLLEVPWAARAVRMAVGIGRDADHNVLTEFIADPAREPVTAANPEQLVRMIRWASTHASRLASALSGATELEEETISETVW